LTSEVNERTLYMYGGIINSLTEAKAEEGETSTGSRAEPQRGLRDGLVDCVPEAENERDK